jgi:hypothetical protein
MNNRLDRSEDRALLKRISDLETKVAELNTFQRLGSHSVVTNRIFSANAFDIEVDNVPAFVGSGGAYQTILVTFTPSSSNFANMSFVHRMFYTYTQDMTNGYTLGISWERLLPIGNQQQWKLYIQSNSTYVTAWLRLKFYFFAIGAGTFTAVLLP